MAKTQSPSDVLPGTVFTPRQVRILKWAVIIMGLLLVGGFAFVMSAIVYQASHLGESGTTSSPAAPPVSTDLNLPKDMAISHMALGDNRLAVHLKGAGTQEIRIIDLGTGAIISRFSVKSD